MRVILVIHRYTYIVTYISPIFYSYQTLTHRDTSIAFQIFGGKSCLKCLYEVSQVTDKLLYRVVWRSQATDKLLYVASDTSHLHQRCCCIVYGVWPKSPIWSSYKAVWRLILGCPEMGKTRLFGCPQPQMYPPVALNQYTWANRTRRHFI